jgi:cytochrome bd ubiquinol oxidase subunit II
LSAQPGILDWYTVLIGVIALVAVIAHGSLYVALKTDEDLGRRARGLALLCWPMQFFLTCISLIATYFIRPEVMANYSSHKIGLMIPLFVFASLGLMLWANPKGKEKLAVVASSCYIAGMLLGAAFALYPVVVPARDREYSLTIHNTATSSQGLGTDILLWTFGLVLTIACFAFVNRLFGAKVRVEENP